ncbi:hypothetical protein [Nocardia farcinica]|uniref:hypothetical protein n=1 Tax=Nocardia farcinica TaxID=37329 RepID=UPI00189578DA|nr:hypothetical protein [Nocardia farcinica]MBF6139960.1 hypothetical protein [Nocardia farcinica]MBF6258099.1 hypothetical protein [Nocardia farcinica]MBF6384070.1 hypothetical protein [Nocardia farcinica]
MSELLVVTDEEGNIRAATRIGAAPDPDVPEAAHLQVRIAPQAGETVHSVALPDELRAAGSLASLDHYYLDVGGGVARLTRRTAAE